MRFLLCICLVLVPLAPAVAGGEEISAGQLLGEVLRLVEREHVDAGQFSSRALLEGALEGMLEHFPEASHTARFEAGRFWLELRGGGRALVLEGPQPTSLAGLEPLLSRTAEFLQENLRPAPETEAVALALAGGLLGRIDPRSRLLTPASHQVFRRSLAGRTEGVGLLLEKAGASTVIRGTLPGSPAQRKGLKPGTRVELVDWFPTHGLTAVAAEKALQGPAGSEVTLHLMAETGGGLKKVSLRRAAFPLESVGSHLFEEGGDRWIGYLRILEFQGATSLELAHHLNRLHTANQGFMGIILDLRGNPGGVMEEAIHTADRFLNRGTIVTPVRARGASLPVLARGYGAVTEAPMVVLVDENTASGGEIVAAALGANRRALIIGRRTVGKGTVQSVIPLSAGYAVSLTVARLLNPAGHAIETLGVEPDIALAAVVFGAEGVRFHPPAAEGGFPAPARQPLAELSFLAAGAAPGVPLPAQASGRARFLRSDFAVRLARTILVFNQGGAYPALVRNSLELLRAVQLVEQRRITGAMARLGIDWRGGPTSPAARAAITALQAELRLGDPPSSPAGPGGLVGRWARLSVTVANPGEAPLYRLWVRLTGDADFLGTVDLPLGQLGAKKNRSLDTRVALPPDLAGGVRRIGAEIRDQTGAVLHQASLVLAIPPPEPPVLKVHAAPPPGGSTGNGPTRVTLEISNVGKGFSGPIQAVLEIRSGAAQQAPAVSALLEPLPPGQKHTTSLEAHLPPPGQAGAAVVLRIVDRQHPNASLHHRWTLPDGVTLQKPAIDLEPLALSKDDPALTLIGRVTDDQMPTSVTVLLNGRRVLHQIQPERGKSRPLPFRLSAHLRQGSNEILIQSPDATQLVGERRIILWHGPGRELAGDRWFQVLK